MPTTAEKNQANLLAISAVLTQVGGLQQHKALMNRPANDPHAAIIAEINEELRSLQGCLSEYDPADKAQITKWCADKRTINRLDNIQLALDTLDLVEKDEELARNIQPRGNNTWRDRAAAEGATDHHKLMLRLHVHHLRTGAKYNKEFINYLGLESFLKKQRETAAIIKKLSEIKEGISVVAGVAGKAKGLADRVTTFTKTSANFAHSSEGLTAATTHSATVASATAPALAIFLQAIPIVGAGVTAVTSLIQFGQSFLQKRGVTDKVAKGIMVGVAVAATVLTAIFPIAAAGIAAGMVASGAIMNHIKPYLEVRNQIKNRGADLEALKTRMVDLETKTDITLNKGEKEALIQRLHKNFIQDKSIHLDDLNQAKKAIYQGNMTDILANDQVKNALKLTGTESIKSILTDHNKASQDNVSKDIVKLKKDRNEKLALSVNDVFTVAGAVMLAIPFPPVMIAGAALLVASSIAGIIIKYKDEISHAFTKIKDGFKKLFGIGKNDDATAEDANKNENSLKNSATMHPATHEKNNDLQKPLQRIVEPLIPHADDTQHVVKADVQAREQPLLSAAKLQVDEVPAQVLLKAEKSVAETVPAESEMNDRPRPGK